MELATHIIVINTGCLRKKYGVADYRFFKNGNTLQSNNFRHVKYDFCLVAYEILTPYIKCNKSYELEMNDGSNRTQTVKGQIYTQAYFIIQVPFNPSFLSRS